MLPRGPGRRPPTSLWLLLGLRWFDDAAGWRPAALEAEGVRWCETDFHLATKINFLSEERIACSAKLGLVTTEYFFAYRRRVDEAPEAALVAVTPPRRRSWSGGSSAWA